jgi:nucleoside-diphosphate-sugar epimerase
MDYQRVHGVNTRIVRIFNTYGDRMAVGDGRVIPAFINQALRNEPLTVFGDGKQTRSLCFVSDLVSGLLTVMGNDITTPVNIGNPQEITMLELAKTIIQLTGSSSQIVHKPLPEDDPKRRCPDISLVQSRTYWKPTTSLEDGLRATIDYFGQV